MKTVLFCVWLIPSNPTYETINNTIQHLAKSEQAPSFFPHMTLFCGKSQDIEQTKQQFRELLGEQSSITLKAESIKHTSKYYKTLFIQLTPTDQLQSLNRYTQEALDPNSAYSLNPHASLLYKTLDFEKQSELAKTTWATLKNSVQHVTFNKAMLVSDNEEEGPEAVKSWQILDSIDLKGQ